MFYPKDHYTDGEVVELLEKAEAMGFNLDKGSELEGLTLSQLDQLVSTKQ